ncbi:hypothetical protein BDV93DRAFT_558521 [Ceratobasidium sp. AG-I]|nr:hypothetical protein BDV93DRAFT_558521 [Ceratobasidium sp. AG-I]
MIAEYCGLGSLSPEVILRILTNCRYDDIISFASTSCQYYYLVHESTTLQLQMELQANGLELSDYARANGQKPVDLLRALYEYRDDWLYMRFGPSTHYEFRAEEFAIELYQDTLETCRLLATVDLTEAEVHHIELATGVRRSVIVRGNFFCMQSDPSQDLIVRVQKIDLTTEDNIGRGYIHIRALSSDIPHPLAAHPTIPFKVHRFPEIWDESSIPIQIMNDTLVLHLVPYGPGVMFNDPAQILIGNWKSGQILNHISTHVSCVPRFLSPSSLVLLCKTQGPDDHVPLIELAVYENVQDPLSDNLPPAGTFIGDPVHSLKPCFTFGFPIMNSAFADAKYFNPIWASGGACKLHSACSRFVPDPSCEVLRIVIYVSPLPPVQVLISKVQLLSHIARAKRNLDSSTVGLPWQDWGERATRWIEAEDLPGKQTIHGTRWVRLFEGASQCIRVLEFHSPTVRRFPSSVTAGRVRKPKGNEQLPSLMKTWSESEETAHVYTVVEPGILNSPMFCDPVVSRLPYRVAMLPGPVVLAQQDWRINGQHIVGTPVSSL